MEKMEEKVKVNTLLSMDEMEENVKVKANNFSEWKRRKKNRKCKNFQNKSRFILEKCRKKLA